MRQRRRDRLATEPLVAFADDVAARLVQARTRPGALCRCRRRAAVERQAELTEGPRPPGGDAVSPVISTPTAADVARIAAIRNRVLRNLEITQCYAELSDTMRARIGGAADWCAFATWASRQAGSTIRGEDLLARFRRRLGEGARLLEPVQSVKRWLLRKGLFEPHTRLGRVVAAVHTPFDAFERASEAVAIGNLKVFEEIADAFARFLAAVPPDAGAGSPDVVAFASTLRPGPPPDGQQLLRDAFAHYQRQRHEPDPALHAGWVLLANLEIGLHEQTRLQPQITAAVDAPLVTARDLGARVLRVLAPTAHRWPRALFDPTASLVGRAALVVRRAATRVTREVVTESLMVLALPGVVLPLGRHLDAPAPPALGIPHPALDSLVREFDPCTPDASDCGARDWCDLRQRMHYIVHLFRAYAVDRLLFARPFTLRQVEQFRNGEVPEGDL
jgi:hypothetical protein